MPCLEVCRVPGLDCKAAMPGRRVGNYDGQWCVSKLIGRDIDDQLATLEPSMRGPGVVGMITTRARDVLEPGKSALVFKIRAK